jgi:hypothetical protein
MVRGAVWSPKGQWKIWVSSSVSGADTVKRLILSVDRTRPRLSPIGRRCTCQHCFLYEKPMRQCFDQQFINGKKPGVRMKGQAG